MTRPPVAPDWRFETARLTVSPWHDATHSRDTTAKELRPILTPEVLLHLPPPLQAVHDIPGWIAARDSESTVLALRQKPDSTLLGLLILAPQPPQSLHIGYLLAQSAWGKGIASELLAGLVEAARGTGTPLTLLGGVDTANPASARVLIKAGFRADPPSTDGMTTYRLALP